MDSKPVSDFPRPTIDQLLHAIPFYKTVKQQDPWQFEMLLQHSRIVNYSPGEVVLKYGEQDHWLYFLLKGQLAVYVRDDVREAQAVNYITPGEVFGDLAMIVEQPRSATVVADPNCKRVTVFGTDFSVFGDLDDFKVINLSTKLIYYRNAVHSLRWKLEVYRSKYPEHPKSSNHHRVKLFTGSKGTVHELAALHSQATELAKLLLGWNEEFGQLKVSESATINPQVVARVE